MVYRYFVTDQYHKGDLVLGNLNPLEMLGILGKFCTMGYTKEKILESLADTFSFSTVAQDLDFTELNQNEKYPFTYYHLLHEHEMVDEYGYYYANIEEISKFILADKSLYKMLNSICIERFKNIELS